MIDLRIPTARGVVLGATICTPEDSPAFDLEAIEAARAQGKRPPARTEGVVVLAHEFLTDRHGLAGCLDAVARRYRQAGLSTLQFDFSGLGDSDDDVITIAGQVEDIQAVCSWLADRGFSRQALHANGLGATAALLARPAQARTAVLVGAVVGPQSILWENVFSPDQLDELARHGLTRLPDDNPNDRQWDVLSKETLADVSMQSVQTTMKGLPWPVLMLHGGLTDEFPGAAEAAAEGFPLLPHGSRLQQIREADDDAAQRELARLATRWVLRRLR